jgi:hypothetical protein
MFIVQVYKVSHGGDNPQICYFQTVFRSSDHLIVSSLVAIGHRSTASQATDLLVAPQIVRQPNKSTGCLRDLEPPT